MDEIARTTPTFAGVSFAKLDARLGAVAVQRQGAGGHADDAHRRLRARQGQLRRHRIRADRREGRAALPAAADHRAHPDRSTTSARRRGARRTWCGTTRTCWRSIRTTPRSAASSDGDLVRLASRVRRDDAARADHRSGGAGRGLHDVPPSGDAGERGHHATIPTGRRTARNTR